MSSEMKPCAGCGAAPNLMVVNTVPWGGYAEATVRCFRCGYEARIEGRGLDEAIKAAVGLWNRYYGERGGERGEES